MNVELKNLKVHRDMSEETTCFSATIYVNGRKAGTVQNDGCGGCNRYRWLDFKLGAEVEAWAVTQPVAVPGVEELDQLLSDLIGKQETLKRLARATKRETWFRLKEDEIGEWRTVKAPFTPAVEEYIARKYNEQVECIANLNLQAAVAYC